MKGRRRISHRMAIGNWKCFFSIIMPLRKLLSPVVRRRTPTPPEIIGKRFSSPLLLLLMLWFFFICCEFEPRDRTPFFSASMGCINLNDPSHNNNNNNNNKTDRAIKENDKREREMKNRNMSWLSTRYCTSGRPLRRLWRWSPFAATSRPDVWQYRPS